MYTSSTLEGKSQGVSPWRLCWDLQTALWGQGEPSLGCSPVVFSPSLCRAVQGRVHLLWKHMEPWQRILGSTHQDFLVSFSPAWPWGALLQEGFKVLPFPWQSLWKELVKLDYFKEELLRISEEMSKCTSESASHVLLSPGWHHMSWRSAVWSRSQVPRLRFDKSWWAEPDGSKNQALLFKLSLLQSWPGSTEWVEVQEQNGEYTRHSDLQNPKDGKTPNLSFFPKELNVCVV